MPREDRKASLGPHASALSSISSADISPHTPIQKERDAEHKQDVSIKHSTAASRLIAESLGQRCCGWVSLAPLAAISFNQVE